jgi:DNA-directed RNA polymerase subunit RPC12/RpoP
MLTNGAIKTTVAELTCPYCGGLLISDMAIDYREGVKSDYYKCVQCARPAKWGPIQRISLPPFGKR